MAAVARGGCEASLVVSLRGLNGLHALAVLRGEFLEIIEKSAETAGIALTEVILPPGGDVTVPG